ncbi:MAG: hypothetical protein R3F11_09920 [Verrucomicrobiales bacterium]
MFPYLAAIAFAAALVGAIVTLSWVIREWRDAGRRRRLRPLLIGAPCLIIGSGVLLSLDQRGRAEFNSRHAKDAIRLIATEVEFGNGEAVVEFIKRDGLWKRPEDVGRWEQELSRELAKGQSAK